MTRHPGSARRHRLLGIGALLIGIVGGACSGSEPDDVAVGSTTTAVGVATTAGTTIETGGGSTVPDLTDPSTSQPATTAGAVASTAAPPATATGETVAVVTLAPQAPTPIGTPAADAGGLQFAIASIAAVEGEASGPGEIGGPALKVTVAATNTSSAPVDLALTVVDLRHGAAETPAVPLSIGTTPFTGSVAAGASATAVYVFAVPVDQRSAVRIYVSARPELPTVVFEGAVS